VRDASGAVFRVTVEASSPALIEKVRSTVTDSGDVPVWKSGARRVLGVIRTSRFHDRHARVFSQSGVVVTINADLRVGAFRRRSR
jgi:hypothetical protein